MNKTIKNNTVIIKGFMGFHDSTPDHQKLIKICDQGNCKVGTIAIMRTHDCKKYREARLEVEKKINPNGPFVKRNMAIFPTYYNSALKYLDSILIDKSVNFVSGGNNVFGEMKLMNGENVHFMLQAEDSLAFGESCKFKLRVDKEMSEDEDMLYLPFLLYSLKNHSPYEETINLFEDVKAEFAKNGKCVSHASRDTKNYYPLLTFGDSVFYGIAFDVKEIEVVDNDKTLVEEAKAAARAGEYEHTEAFSDLEGIPDLSYLKIKPKDSSIAEPTMDFESFKNGDHIINYDWPEELTSSIKPLSTLDDYVPIEAYYDVANKIEMRLNKVLLRMDAGKTGVDAIGKDYVNLLLYGVPGTGKTKTIHAVAAALGLPITFVAPDKDGERDTYEGLLGVDDKGQFSYRETNFLKAFEKGGIVVLEEVNLADQNRIFGALGQAIEAPFQIQKYGGIETVQRHPLCVVIATMNVGTNGSLDLNEALASRFKQKYELPVPTKKDCVDILTKYNPNRKICTWVYDVYSKILEYIKGPRGCEDLERNVSLRSCIGAIEEIEEGKSPKRAITNTIIGDIKIAGFTEMASDIQKNIVEGYRDLLL